MKVFIARISDQQVVETVSQIPSPGFMDAIATNYGGVAADYTYYVLSAEEEARSDNGDSYTVMWQGNTITNLDFTVEDNKFWLNTKVSDTKNKVALNSVDVSKVIVYSEGGTHYQNDLVYKDGKVWKCQVVTSTSAPTEIPGPSATDWSVEARSVLVTLSILKPDLSGVDITHNFVDYLLIKLPVGTASLEVKFVKGICEKVIVFTGISDCGNWFIPHAQVRVDMNGRNFRVKDRSSFMGILPY